MQTRGPTIISPDDHAVLGGPPGFTSLIASRFAPIQMPTQNVLVGRCEPEWPDDGSLDDVVAALNDAGTPVPLASGRFGDEQVLAFLEFRKVLRATPLRVPGLLAHLYGEEDAERLVRAAGW